MCSKFRGFTFLAVLLLVNLLVACSSSDGGDDPSATPRAAKVSGIVNKGIIKNASINVYPVESGAAVLSNALATTQTDGFGKYSVEIPASYSGPVLIVLSNNNNNDATITCDDPIGCTQGRNTFNFGYDMPLGTLELKTYVASVSANASLSAAVTPITHIAAAFAESKGTVDATAIREANTQTGNLLGVHDIVGTQPPDITQTDDSATPDELKYALLSAAILRVANEDFAGDYESALIVLTTDYVANSGQLIAHETTDNPNTISLLELATAARTIGDDLTVSTLNNTGQATSSLEALELVVVQDTPLPDELTSAQASPNSGASQLETVKNFLSDVRTWGTVISQEFEAPSMRLEADANAAGQILDSAMPLVGESFGLVIGTAFNAYLSQQDVVNIQDFIDSEQQTDPTLIATATGSAVYNSANETVVVNGSIIMTTTIYDDLGNPSEVTDTQTVSNLSISFPARTGTTFTLTFNGGSVQNDGARMQFNAGSTTTLTFVSPVEDIIPQIDGTLDPPALPDLDSWTMDLSASIEQISGSPRFSFNGDIAFKLVTPKDSTGAVYKDAWGGPVINPASFEMIGIISSTAGDSLTGTFKFTQPNASTFVPLQPPFAAGQENPNAGSYTLNATTLTLNVPGYSVTAVFDGASSVAVTENYSYGGSYSYSYNGSLDQFIAFNIVNRTFWGYVANEGDYITTIPATLTASAGSNLAAIMEYPDDVPEEDANNFRIFADAMFSYRLKLTELPEARFVVTADITGFETGTMNMTLSYGARSFSISGDIVNGEVDGTFSITNQDGVTLSMTVTTDPTVTNVGELTYDGLKFGDLERLSNGMVIVRFTDGSFESLSSF